MILGVRNRGLNDHGNFIRLQNGVSDPPTHPRTHVVVASLLDHDIQIKSLIVKLLC